MKRVLARALSFIFHPVILALFAPALIIHQSSTDLLYLLKWISFSSVFLVGIFLVLYTIRRDQIFSDFDFYHRESRPVFFATCLFFAVGYFIAALLIKGIFFPLSIVALGIIVGLGVIDVLNRYLKVSVHTTVACAFVVTVGLLYGFLPFLAVVIIPFAVAWSRRVLKQHTIKDILTGAALGTVLTILTFIAGKVII